MEEISGEEAAPEPETKAREAVAGEVPAQDSPVKKWRCTVCNYIHEGPEPPDICPVCGADKSKFVEFKDGDDIPSRKKAAPKKENKPEEVRETYTVDEGQGSASVPEPEPLGFIEKYDHWLSPADTISCPSYCRAYAQWRSSSCHDFFSAFHDVWLLHPGSGLFLQHGCRVAGHALGAFLPVMWTGKECITEPALLFLIPKLSVA